VRTDFSFLRSHVDSLKFDSLSSHSSNDFDSFSTDCELYKTNTRKTKKNSSRRKIVETR
jgi:hypothetical protein